MGNVLFELCQSHATGIERAAESWKKEHRQAMFVRDVEFMVSMSLETPEFLKELTRSVFDRMAANQIDDYQAVGKKVQQSFQTAQHATMVVRECIQIAQQASYHVEGSKEFERIEDTIKQMRKDFDQRWPWIDDRRLQESLAAYERGQSRSAKEILDELRSSGAQTR